MHVIVAIDGSVQSLEAARRLRSWADPAAITEISIVAVVRPFAAVAFADDTLDEADAPGADVQSFRRAAESALAKVAAEFEGWGPTVHQLVRSGSPASEIIKLAEEVEAELLVVASGGRGLSETVLLGSTAQRVQQYAPCPVLVVRPPRRKRRAARS